MKHIQQQEGILAASDSAVTVCVLFILYLIDLVSIQLHIHILPLLLILHTQYSQFFLKI